MHNAALAALGLDWRYLAFDVSPACLRQVLVAAKGMGFIGFNLTVPHKVMAVGLMDELDESAHRWGAVNTVRFEGRCAGGEWQSMSDWPDESPAEVRAKGFNTDAEAVALSLQEDLGIRLAGARVVLLGAGGVGRVVAMRLASEGIAGLWLINRSQAKAEALRREILETFPKVKIELDYPQDEIDLLVNATSLGLKADDALPWDSERFQVRQARSVYDLIYRPAITPMLQRAKEAGCRTANGLGMLLHQGARALEIWLGRPAPVEVMRKALEESIYV
jgi:shikimate dehydrogenase